jgi:hypothetical protein
MIEINYRKPHIDRFLEIIATAKHLKKWYSFSIDDLPRVYGEIIDGLNLRYLLNIGQSKPELYTEYKTHPIDFTLLLKPKKLETIAEINARINSVNIINSNLLDKSSTELLKAASNNKQWNVDQIKTCVDLAEVVASMEGSTIEVMHIAEVINYIV